MSFIKGFNYSTCKLIAWVQMGSYEALQTAKAKNGSKHFMWTVISAIAFTNIATQGLWWDSKREKKKRSKCCCLSQACTFTSVMEADRINVHCCYQQLLLYSRRHRFENRPQLLPLHICLNVSPPVPFVLG
jgi:hypothetical protein